MIQVKASKGACVGASLLMVLAASCGGGGSSPPPPPPSPPAVVVATASASATSVQEGQPFSVDASASTTNSGSPLTFVWTQVSGPTVAISNPNTAKLDLTAAEVTADSTAQFRVTVTAGSLTSQATLDVTFTNIAQTPAFLTLDLAASTTFNGTFSNAVEAILGDWSFGLVGTTTTPGGPVTFAEFAQTGTQVVASPGAPFSQSFPQPATFALSTHLIGTNLDFSAPFFLVTEENADRYRIFRRTSIGAYSTIFLDRSITRPCATHYPNPLKPPLGPTVFIGQRARGFSIISLDTTGALYQEINTGQSFCALAMAEAPINSTSSLFHGPSPTMEDVIAIDTTANMINQFGSSAGDPTRYALKAQVPVQLNSSTPLTFVAATPVRSKDAFGAFGPVAGLALVYTDGQHNGQHRLVLVGLSATNRSIFQTTRSWPIGIPAGVIEDDLDGDNFPEIIVISSTSPQAIVFEMTSPSSTPIPSALTGIPSFMEIGLGATKALPLTGNILSTGGLYVAYRDRNMVRLYTRP